MKRFIDVDEAIITLNAHMNKVLSGAEVSKIVGQIYSLGFEHAADVLRECVPSYEPSEIAKLIPHAERDNAAEERCNGSKDARRGHWKLDPVELEPRCSYCGKFAWEWGLDPDALSPYCPNCGAKMDEEGEAE